MKHWPTPCTLPPRSSSTTTNLASSSQDYDRWLEQLAPHEPVSQYQHNDTGEDNADAHIKRQVMGCEVAVAITPCLHGLPGSGQAGDELDFGPWEQSTGNSTPANQHKVYSCSAGISIHPSTRN